MPGNSPWSSYEFAASRTSKRGVKTRVALRCGPVAVCWCRESSRRRHSGAKSEDGKEGKWVESVRAGAARGRQARGRALVMR